MKYPLAIVLAFIFLALPAAAQPAAPPLDPAKVALGGDIFDLFVGKQDYQARIRAVVQALIKNEPADSQASESVAMTNVGKSLEDLKPTMRRAYAEAYARHFSLDELKEIKTFYQSPAGSELLTEQPKISLEVLQEIGPELMSRIRADAAQPPAEQPK